MLRHPEPQGRRHPPCGRASEGGSDADVKVAELTADLQRAHADFANYRKRVERDRQAVIDSAKASVVTQLLGVLDDLDRAREHGDLESGPLRSVSDKLTAALEGLGLATFGAEGDDFDPSLHEAVQHDGQDGHPVLAACCARATSWGPRAAHRDGRGHRWRHGSAGTRNRGCRNKIRDRIRVRTAE